MNPFSILQGGMSGGSIAPSSSASSSGESGPATGTTNTGNKIFNLGASNPNTATGVLQNPLVLVALVAGVYLVAKR